MIKPSTLDLEAGVVKTKVVLNKGVSIRGLKAEKRLLGCAFRLRH